MRGARAAKDASADAPLIEADRRADLPHPRETAHLFGHGAAEADFLEAFAGGRMHHAWLITGPEGVGKATLAWRMARFLLTAPDPAQAGGGLFGDVPVLPENLDVAPDHPVARRLLALSEPRLLVLRRAVNDKTGKLSAEITIDEVRRLNHFFALSAVDGGRRVVIVDAADELNRNAANGILKLLEEPPQDAVILLVAHQPARLLPTIRSRCRQLRLGPLGQADLARALGALDLDLPQDAGGLVELAQGSVGAAAMLVAGEGMALYQDLVTLLAALPRLDRARALALSEVAASDPARFDLILQLLDRLLARLARAGALGAVPPQIVEGEGVLLAQSAGQGAIQGRIWADLADSLATRARAGRAVNLDPATLLLDMLFAIEKAVAPLGAPSKS